MQGVWVTRTCLEGRQASLDLEAFASGIELIELRVQRDARDLGLAGRVGLRAPYAILAPRDLRRRVEDADPRDRPLHEVLRVCGLLPGHQGVAPGLEIGQLLLHGDQARLEVLHDVRLGREKGLRVGGAAVRGDLLGDRQPSEVVVLLRVRGVAGGTHLVGPPRRRCGLLPPARGGDEVGGVVLLGHAQVADGLGDRVLGLSDGVRVVANKLVEHRARVLGVVEE